LELLESIPSSAVTVESFSLRFVSSLIALSLLAPAEKKWARHRRWDAERFFFTHHHHRHVSGSRHRFSVSHHHHRHVSGSRHRFSVSHHHHHRHLEESSSRLSFLFHIDIIVTFRRESVIVSEKHKERKTDITVSVGRREIPTVRQPTVENHRKTNNENILPRYIATILAVGRFAIFHSKSFALTMHGGNLSYLYDVVYVFLYTPTGS
jgi:hypothetical protein